MARKILLADDSVTAQNMGRKILTDAGYEVMTVNNGSAALKRVTEQRPDLIVLDVYMPGYSGLEVCQRLKDSRDTSRIPILLTVGKLEPFKPEDARRVSADAFIVKPFEASELLSALTRLEDRIVPSGDAPRFSNTVSGIERFVTESSGRNRDAGDAGDTGWKSRIRFPSKKKKAEEPEPEADDLVNTPSFRDFRRGAAKTPGPPKDLVAAPARPEPLAVQQEPGLVPDLPHDITPDELDALSALVAKLDGPMPRSEEIAPIGDKLGPIESANSKAETSSEPESKQETTPETSHAPAAVPAAAEPSPAISAVESASSAEAVAEAATQPPAFMPEIMTPNTTVPSSEEPPAPVDQEDEPFFATAASAVPQTESEQEAVSAVPTEISQAGAMESKSPEPPPAPELAASAQPEEPAGIRQAETESSKVEEMLVEAVAEEAVSEEVIEGLEKSREHAPTDEELAEALRLLTPLQEHKAEHAHPAPVEPQEPGSASTAAQSAVVGGTGPRWLAEAVELAPEEASMSLEAEMFRSFTPAPAFQPVPAPPSAVVEDSITNAENMKVPAAEASLEPATAVSIAASETALDSPSPASMPDRPVEPVAESQEAVSATFAAQSPQEEVVVQSSAVAANESASTQHQYAASTLETNYDDTGDQQAMSKTDGKSSKTGWHQIRAAAAPSPKDDLVEAAKQNDAEEAPKAMAAAAASEDTSSSSGADSSAIASIVDSVLADLRPKIVEEIAKKLAKK